MDWEILGKGLSKTIKEFGDIKANEIKLNSALLANQFEKKQNLLYKMQEKEMERQSNLEFAKQMQAQFQGDGQRDEITAPRLGFGAGMQPTFSMPSSGQQKFDVSRRWAQIEQKQANNLPLNNLDKMFMERYPKSMLGGGKNYVPNKEVTQKVINNIKSSEDLKDLLTNKEAYKEAGVDIGEVIRAHLDTAKKDSSIWDNIMKFFQ